MEGDEGAPILGFEAETLRRVSNSISAIEIALAEWEASEKPKELERNTRYLRMSHELLSAWGRESLLGDKSTKSSKERLRRFSEICKLLEARRPG